MNAPTATIQYADRRPIILIFTEKTYFYNKGAQTYLTFYANNFDHNCGIFSNSGPTTDFSNIFVRDRDPFADQTVHRTNIF